MNKDKIIIKGARTNNLKDINIEIPRNQMVIMTGLSGSGKTSLAFDTIYAEGQRRYVESLSAYARQFLGGVEKPDVDLIEGLSPSISIDQKTTSNNPRSTVGTVTEIYDYLRLLYARVGDPICPNHHIPITSQTITQMVDKVMTYEDNERIEILAPIISNQKGTFKDLIEKLIKDGFIRAYIDQELVILEEVEALDKNKKHTIDVVVDRLVKKDDIRSRLFDSFEICLGLTDGIAVCKVKEERELFSANYACPICGFSLPTLEPRLFSFNNPLGACEDCKGLGFKQKVDIDYLIPDFNVSIKDGGIRYYKNIVDTENIEWNKFKQILDYYKIDYTKPLNKLTKKELNYCLYGSDVPIKYTLVSSSGNVYQRNEFIEGIVDLIERRHQETTSQSSREWYATFMDELPCPTCHGKRLNEKVLSVRVGGLNIDEFTKMSIKDAHVWISELKLDEQKAEIARLVIVEIKNRLSFLIDVGLDYLTLNRMAGSLSGGEAQRIRLATQIGSKLTGVLYVLDEPSIGLHQKDNEKLINTLIKMRDLGNSLIIVEHDEETMLASDYIIDIGPGAGLNGGEVIAAGTPQEVMDNEKSITGQYLSGKMKIDVPETRRKGNGKFLEVVKASENNLKDVSVKIPFGTMSVVTGVSGSGKSTLVNEVISKAVQHNLGKPRVKPGAVKKVKGMENIDKIITISQDPIGRTPRSNPVTYTGVFDEIRDLFALTKEAKIRGYDKGRFSFNVKGGRCEACQGDGVKKISMHFLPDVYVPCSVCHGKRYNEETLQVKYKEKNIYEILEMTIDESIEFFDSIHKIRNRLKMIQDVGLGYIKLGQSATTLSGGEAQRVKLASELQKKATGKTLFVLDEPTTGLHSEDVKKLLLVLQRIVDHQDTVLIIEHNLDIIKSADYLIDLGPNGGDNGGEVVAIGSPEQVMKVKESYTGQYLKKIMEG